MSANLAGSLIVGEALTRLAIARGAILDDMTAEVYLDALSDRSPDLVREACRDLSRLPRSDYETAMPSVGTIRELCDQIARQRAADAAARRLLPAPKGDEDSPQSFCLVCHDEANGWQVAYCKGSGPQYVDAVPERHAQLERGQCGRRQGHGPHAWAVSCACVDVNPVIAKARERAARTRGANTRRRSSAAGARP